MKRLTAWGTIFIVITAIAGIYGMNFKFMPELEWRYGYFVVLFSMVLISLTLYFYFRGKGFCSAEAGRAFRETMEVTADLPRKKSSETETDTWIYDTWIY